MFAEGADEVGGQLVTHVLVTADDAAPDSLAFGGLTRRLGFRLDMLLIVAVSSGRDVSEHFSLSDGSDEKDMGAEINDLLHLDGNEGVGAACDSQCAVGDAEAVGETVEFINLAPALEPEVLEQLEVSGLAENGGGKLSRTLDEFGGQVALVESHGNAVGLHGHLHDGVADAAVVAAAVASGNDKQAVLDIEKGIAHKYTYFFECAKILIL